MIPEAMISFMQCVAYMDIKRVAKVNNDLFWGVISRLDFGQGKRLAKQQRGSISFYNSLIKCKKLLDDYAYCAHNVICKEVATWDFGK